MKRRDLIVFSTIFLLSVGITTEIVKYQLTGDHLTTKSVITNLTNQQVGCSAKQLKARPATVDPQLKALGDYEAACKSAFVDNMMIFTNMPVSVASAESAADKMAIRLKEFSAQGISPIVIAEPDSDWGLIDFHEFSTGLYDQWIQTYFKRLQSIGVTDSMLGLWIPFPEPQQDFWNNNKNPDDFANSVNRYFATLRSVYPKANTGILLDSQVGETEQSSQLLAYTRLVDNKLVDVAGLQGFPWHPVSETDERKPVTSAAEFAPASLLKEVADSLGTKKVMFNIGTYRHRKSSNGGDIAVTAVERQSTLDSIVHEVSVMKDAQYDVLVNVFAENKFDAKEGVDWSYWEPGKYATSEQTVLFTKFVNQLNNLHAKISLFDSRN